ncbi:hypothetical protein [Cytobacillus praedii]|uniref:hypothetical protein n=1 Tax=Cytobacillus praedii TaxID=1742358 RepID=UPI002E1F03F5|nr:hypothetical protein [Cytobacillus praedii]
MSTGEDMPKFMEALVSIQIMKKETLEKKDKSQAFDRTGLGSSIYLLKLGLC